MYAELGTLITESGGEWAYIKWAFGQIPSYLDAWMSITVIRPSGVSIIALTSAEYVLGPVFIDGCGAPPIAYTKMMAIVIVRESKLRFFYLHILLGYFNPLLYLLANGTICTYGTLCLFLRLTCLSTCI